MDFISGRTLQNSWETTLEKQLMATTNELRGCYLQLCVLEGINIGAADRGPVLAGTYAAEAGGAFQQRGAIQ